MILHYQGKSDEDTCKVGRSDSSTGIGTESRVSFTALDSRHNLRTSFSTLESKLQYKSLTRYFPLRASSWQHQLNYHNKTWFCSAVVLCLISPASYELACSRKLYWYRNIRTKQMLQNLLIRPNENEHGRFVRTRGNITM